MDHQDAARFIRNKYVPLELVAPVYSSSVTARLGTIWHVVVGETKCFHMEPARGASEHVIVALKKGGTKIELYRHKQVTPSGLVALKPSLPSLSTILDILPKILFMFLCVSFLVQRSAFCQAESESMGTIKRGICSAAYSIPLAPLAGMLFAGTLLKEVRKRYVRKQGKQKTQ